MFVKGLWTSETTTALPVEIVEITKKRVHWKLGDPMEVDMYQIDRFASLLRRHDIPTPTVVLPKHKKVSTKSWTMLRFLLDFEYSPVFVVDVFGVDLAHDGTGYINVPPLTSLTPTSTTSNVNWTSKGNYAFDEMTVTMLPVTGEDQ